MANVGYNTLLAPQLTPARLVAPPLGHIPPPPPTIPPPFLPFSSTSVLQSLEYSQRFITLGQYAHLYQQSTTTHTNADSQSTTVSTENVTDNKTMAEVTGTLSNTTKADRIDDSPTEPPSSSEVKYKSDEGLKMKFSGGFAAKKRPHPSTIAVQLKPQVSLKKPKTDASKLSVALAFESSSDEEQQEEMPRAAKLRMRNMGKDTPTSAGPNSFNKSSKGFTDQTAVFKKQFGV